MISLNGISHFYSIDRFNFKMSGANGVIDHLGAASVEAMDTSDASNTIPTRFTVKPSINTKSQANKPIDSGKIFLLDSHRNLSIISSQLNQSFTSRKKEIVSI